MKGSFGPSRRRIAGGNGATVSPLGSWKTGGNSPFDQSYGLDQMMDWLEPAG
jgi:hypothetical protein